MTTKGTWAWLREQAQHLNVKLSNALAVVNSDPDAVTDHVRAAIYAVPHMPELGPEPKSPDDLRALLVHEQSTRFALMQGVFDGARGQRGLGDSARARGFRSRTPKGDAYESGFLWGRDERSKP